MILASGRQTTPLRADLHAATAVLAQILARGAQLNAGLTPIHLFITSRSIKHSPGSPCSRSDRPPLPFKSP